MIMTIYLELRTQLCFSLGATCLQSRQPNTAYIGQTPSMHGHAAVTVQPYMLRPGDTKQQIVQADLSLHSKFELNCMQNVCNRHLNVKYFWTISDGTVSFQNFKMWRHLAKHKAYDIDIAGLYRS